jgi:hypothetical protein
VPVPELETSVFVIPRDYVKNGLDRFVVLNRIAKSVIDGCRGEHSEFVFTRRGKPIARINNSADNGKPMRASTMITTLQWLGVVPSFSRPHVSDDNPYSEALFRTLKHTPAYPRMPFTDTAAARNGSGTSSTGTTKCTVTARYGS